MPCPCLTSSQGLVCQQYLQSYSASGLVLLDSFPPTPSETETDTDADTENVRLTLTLTLTPTPRKRETDPDSDSDTDTKRKGPDPQRKGFDDPQRKGLDDLAASFVFICSVYWCYWDAARVLHSGELLCLLKKPLSCLLIVDNACREAEQTALNQVRLRFRVDLANL